MSYIDDAIDYEEFETSAKQQELEREILAEKALAYATAAHEGQLRDGGEPYIEHPRRVAALVKELFDSDPSVSIIAYLHDCIEDCDITYEDIKSRFGKLYADSVLLLTRQPSDSYEEYLSRIFSSDYYAAQRIKLCDRIDNVRSLSTCPDEKKVHKYIEETKALFLPITAQAEFKRFAEPLTAALEEAERRFL